MIRRLTPFLPVAGLLVLAVMFAGAASGHTTLDCERSAGLCVVERRSFFTTSQHRLWIESVAEVRYVGGLGKGGNRGQVQLIFTSGSQYDLATQDEDDARARHAEVEAFFAGRGGGSLLVEERGSPWFYLAAAASVIGAIVLAVRAARRRPPEATSRTPSTFGPRVRRFFAHREVRVFGAILAAAAVIQIIWMLWAGHTQGLLLLECKTRCRFQNAECLPRGSVRMSLDPGDYTIEVWSPQGDGRLWHPRTFTITRGETTTFTCAP